MVVVEGFDGDSDRAAELDAALRGLLDRFPEHLEKAHRRIDQFDAIVRAHKGNRLEIPIQALRRADSGFEGMSAHRLAWFVPSLLAAWLAHEIEAAELEAIVAEWAPTDEEAEALAAFFEAALDAALATPLRPARATHERPLEDGVRIWSLHAPSIPLEVLRIARALSIDLEPLVVHWAFVDDEHLLEAVFDPTVASKHYLAHEAVADRLGAAFFEATGERQLRLSKAEKTVRRNIARREDF
jgi:hypothetical protein